MSPNSPMPRWHQALDVLVSGAILIACGAIIWVTVVQPPSRGDRATGPPLPVTALSLEGAPTLGDSRAKVALIQFSEMQCPYCGRFARDTLPALKKEYVDSGQLLVAFRHCPLPAHAEAHRLAQAAECAGRQGHFWQFHDRVFSQVAPIVVVDPARFALELQLDMTQFARCLERGDGVRRVQDDLAIAAALQVTATPTFFLGTLDASRRVRVVRRISGARPQAEFAQAIRAFLVDDEE